MAKSEKVGNWQSALAAAALDCEQVLGAFVDHPAGIMLSEDGLILAVNRQMCALLGQPWNEVVGRQSLELVAAEDRAAVIVAVAAQESSAQERGAHSTALIQTRIVSRTGEAIPVELSVGRLPLANRNVRLTFFRDVREQVRTAEELDRQRRTLEAIVEDMPAGVFVVRASDGKPIMENSLLRAQVGKELAKNLPPEELARYYTVYQYPTNKPYPNDELPIVQAMHGRATLRNDIEIRRPDGTHILLQVNGVPIRDATGETVMAVVMSQDITERTHALEKLEDEKEFLGQLLRNNERDRQLMAYEIHDGLVQYITGAVYQLESISQDASVPQATRDRLIYAQGLLRKSIDDARRVLSGLRPPVLDEQGIATAIDYLIAETTFQSNCEVAFTKHGIEGRLDSFVEAALFRIAQESLNNVAQHSRATHAHVLLHNRADCVVLQVNDNGVGFDPARVPHDRLGLQGMKRRAEMLGGTAEMDSSPGQGTTIRVVVPHGTGAGK